MRVSRSSSVIRQPYEVPPSPAGLPGGREGVRHSEDLLRKNGGARRDLTVRLGRKLRITRQRALDEADLCGCERIVNVTGEAQGKAVCYLLGAL